MPECRVCGQEKPKGEEVRVYTAKVLEEEKKQITTSSTSVTTTYGDFREHRYFVCDNCKMWRDTVGGKGLIALAALACLVLLVVGATQHIAWMWPVGLFALIAGGVVAILVSVDQKLEGAAKEERNSDDPIKAFNERAFKSLAEK